MKIFELIQPQGLFEIHGFAISETFTVSAESFLSPGELATFTNFEHPSRKNQYLQSRYYLKQHLSLLLNKPAPQISFSASGEGKPILADNSMAVDFNISHTENFFVYGITLRGHIGVDIEKKRNSPQLDKIAERLFTESELKHLALASSPQAKLDIFTRLWSLKESIVKTAAGGVFRHGSSTSIDCLDWKIEKLPEDFGQISSWQTGFVDKVLDHVVSYSFREKSLI